MRNIVCCHVGRPGMTSIDVDILQRLEDITDNEFRWEKQKLRLFVKARVVEARYTEVVNPRDSNFLQEDFKIVI